MLREGEVRYVTPNSTLPTRYTFTGQYSHVADEATDLGTSGFGLLFFNARWYDPYLNHFTQPDSIVPNPANPQDWNRYSYARYNPIRYTDSSGHNVDCGIGTECVGDPTPGMIMADAIHQRIHEKDDQIGFMLLTREIDQINAYMSAHPNYDPKSDSLFVSAKPAQRWFVQARLDYWKEIVPWPPKERMSYMEYYDFNQTVIAHGFDPSRVSWGNVLLDVAGIPLGLTGYGGVTSALKLSDPTIKSLSRLSFFASGFSVGFSVATTDNDFGSMLSAGGAIPGPGAAFSAMSLVLDLNQGWYQYEWLP